MDTIIIDLFHSSPEEIGPKAAEHDIVGTSESGINFVLYYNKKQRFYYCEDIDHEISIQNWHEADNQSKLNNTRLVDVQSASEPFSDLASQNTKVRLILSGQGALKKDGFDEDMIAGYGVDETLSLIDDFVSALSTKFCDAKHPLKIVLFKEMVSFSKQGEYMSFCKDGSFKEQTLENLTPETATIVTLIPKAEAKIRLDKTEEGIQPNFLSQFRGHKFSLKRKSDHKSKENEDPEENIEKNNVHKKAKKEDPS